MQIGPGARIGHLLVSSKIGEGGMGEVWRATDSRLGRDVAVKVISPPLVNDPDRLARFEREARVLAALTHPGIASIYGVEPLDGSMLLIMELAAGETLETRIRRGAVPVDEAIEIAKQIASAIEAAHEKGIVHRDLKPGNVVVDGEGRVKVLDFGLAKAISPDEGDGSPDVTTSPTILKSGTREGVILGTAAYMSPEQARGRRVDERADIWALGVILWEMLTGRRLFIGETVSDTIAAVLKEEPDFSALPAETPDALRRLLRRTLRKNPRERLRHIGDAILELDEAAIVEKEADDSPRRLRWRTVAAALIIAALGVAAFVAATRSRTTPERDLIAFTIHSPTGHGFDSIPAISPDGKFVAFIASEEPENRIWIRRLDSLDARPLPGTEGARMLFWSPDSRSLGFGSNQHLRRIDLDGGTRVICPIREVRGASWSPDGQILFADVPAGLRIVPAIGGEPRPIAAVPGHDVLVFWPVLLPDGRTFVFKVTSLGNAAVRGGIYAGRIDSDERRLLVAGNDITKFGRLEFDPEGWLVYERDGALVAQRFDSRRLELSGEPVRVVERVYSSGPRDTRFSVGPGGLLAWRDESTYQLKQLTWFGRSGETLGTVGPPDRWASFAIAPDEKSVAAAREDGTVLSLFLLDVARGTASRLTSGTYSFDPVWSPDGKRIVYAASSGSPPNPFMLEIDGKTEPRRLAHFRAPANPSSWSPDGRWIVAHTANSETDKGDLWRIPTTDGKPELLIGTSFHETHGAISPDGRWIAYTSDEGGEPAIYVTAFAEPRRRWQVSVGEGSFAQWRGDGREIYYSRPAGPRYEIIAVPVQTAPAFSAGTPRLLFTAHAPNFEVTADGGRFLIAEPSGPQSNPPLKVVTDWKRYAGITR